MSSGEAFDLHSRSEYACGISSRAAGAISGDADCGAVTSTRLNVATPGAFRGLGHRSGVKQPRCCKPGDMKSSYSIGTRLCDGKMRDSWNEKI